LGKSLKKNRNKYWMGNLQLSTSPSSDNSWYSMFTNTAGFVIGFILG
jgi:hypothetical protein